MATGNTKKTKDNKFTLTLEGLTLGELMAIRNGMYMYGEVSRVGTDMSICVEKATESIMVAELAAEVAGEVDRWSSRDHKQSPSKKLFLVSGKRLK